MRRIIRDEILAQASPADKAASLRDIARLNRWFGGYHALLSAMRRLALTSDEFTVLDVGAASGDMGAALRRRFPRVRVTNLDFDPQHLVAAPSPRLTADAFHLPFAARSFDIVMANLFLHHFPDDEIVALLRSFGAVARRGVLVVDLWRHPFARAFLPATRGVLRWHPITVHDGIRSVEAAFTADELAALAGRAGLRDVAVRRYLPWFRLSLAGKV